MFRKIKTYAILILVVLALFCMSASVHAFNEYDKIWHFSVSSVFGAAGETFLHYNTELATPQRIVYGTLLGTIPGLLKEFYDDRQRDNEFCWGDMAANAGGALVGALISNYINNRIEVRFNPKAKKATVSYKIAYF